MAQVQCPNCGGYKIITEKQVTIAYEKKKVQNTFGQTIVLLVMLGLLAWWFLSAVQHGSTLGMILAGVLFIFLAFRVIQIWTGQARVRVPSVIKYDLYCQLCGYRWTWQNDQPYPAVNVNPALIQQGEQRLQQEEEQRRREQQQRDMEAAWLASQQHKK